MTVTPLSNNEAATNGGYNYAAHIKVADGDLNTAETLNVLALGLGWAVVKAALIIKTAWTGGSSETISLGIAASTTSSTTLMNAVSATATANTVYIDDGTGDTSGASEYLTITRGGTGTSTAGEAILLFQAIDLTKTADVD